MYSAVKIFLFCFVFFCFIIAFLLLHPFVHVSYRIKQPRKIILNLIWDSHISLSYVYLTVL